jgi:TolB protein
MRAVLAAAAVVVTLAVAVPRSLATFPGTNGLLAYEAQVGKRAQLFTVKMDGSGVRQLTHFTDSDAVWGEWSPNGKTIAFERDVYTGVRVSRALIESTNADGSGPHVLRPAGLNGRPSWSPEGQRIVYSTLQYGQQATISVMAANGTRVRPLLSTPLPAKGLGQGLDSPTFSPDGQRIAFVWIKKAGSAIFTITAGGGGLKQLTPWKNGVADKIDWSPDGSRIAFSSPEFGVRPGISSNVFTIRGFSRMASPDPMHRCPVQAGLARQPTHAAARLACRRRQASWPAPRWTVASG